MTEEQYKKYKAWLTYMRDTSGSPNARSAYDDALAVLLAVKHSWPMADNLPPHTK